MSKCLFDFFKQQFLKFQANFFCKTPEGGCFQWARCFIFSNFYFILFTSNNIMIRPFAIFSVPTALTVLSALNSNEHICKITEKNLKRLFYWKFCKKSRKPTNSCSCISAKVGLSPPDKIHAYCFVESPSKIMKDAFYFI